MGMRRVCAAGQGHCEVKEEGHVRDVCSNTEGESERVVRVNY